MKKTTVLLLAGGLTAVAACKSSQTETTSVNTETTTEAAVTTAEPTLTYPNTKKVDHVENYHGKQIPDPYRWLETHNDEVDQWIKAQNAVTQEYLGDIDFRDNIKARLTEIWTYPKYGAPFK